MYSQRHKLLPVLHALQARVGFLSPGALNYVSERLNVAPAEVHGVASFYGMFSLSSRPKVVAHVCDDIACLALGAAALCADLERTACPVGATWQRSPCLGLCERAPAALVTAAGEVPREHVIAPANVDLVHSVVRDAVAGRLLAEPDALSAKASVPQAGQTQLRLLRRIGHMDPSNLDDYRRLGGYEALRRALDLGPEGVVREVVESKLLGRGGAAFPTGKKWEALLEQRHLGRTHYVICNADESEPGTFKDRVVMEGDPFAVIEGMTIAALATGAQQGYLYIRGEYPLAAETLRQGIRTARAQGLLGDHILSSGLRFDIEVRRGARANISVE
jgi:NADH-quinone oxidoreductase subunit F